MDYSKIYIELIERANDRVLDCYTEKHHIVPKCMGGDNKPRNIAILTPEEHFLAHQLLIKIFPDNHKLVYAANAMSMDRYGKRVNNKSFGWLKRKHSHALSNLNKGSKRSDESKKKMSEAQKGNTKGLGTTRSKEFKRKLSEFHKGNSYCLGRTLKDESKKKISESLKQPILQFSKDGIFIMEFPSAKDAGIYLLCNPTHISCCCRGERKSAHGYIWKLKV